MTFALIIRTGPEIKAEDLAAARSAALAQIPVILVAAAKAITGNVPVSEQVSWPVKALAAQTYLAGTATYDQLAQLQDEADLTGETIADLAAAIDARATAYARAAAKLSGLRRASENAITSAKSIGEMESAMAALNGAIAGL